MKATQYAITVQYGGGFHSFVAYHTEPGAAMVEAQDRSTSLNAEYDKKTGRRGVRPTVMVWEKMGDDPLRGPEGWPERDREGYRGGDIGRGVRAAGYCRIERCGPPAIHSGPAYHRG
jgi:hypothetical protein